MNRAGREPAEDLKRRIVAACEEVGLKKGHAWARQAAEHRTRVLMIGASPPNWSSMYPVVEILATVGFNGDWSGNVDIRCSASDPDEPDNFWRPVMQGRHEVPLGDLIPVLQEVLEERAQVLESLRAGRQGPFRFPKAVWVLPGEAEEGP